MDEKIIKKIDCFFEKNKFDSEALKLFTTEEKIYIVIHSVKGQDNVVFNAFIENLSRRKINIFEDGELHSYLSKHPYINNDFWALGRYVDNSDDAKYVLSQFGFNISPDHFEYFLKNIARNINDSKLIEDMYLPLKKYMFSEDEYNSIILNALICLDNDDYIIKFLRNPLFKLSDIQKASLLSSISSDKIKISNLSIVSPKNLAVVIASLSSDDVKVKFLDMRISSAYLIIESLESDELREKYLNKYWVLLKDKKRAQIIRSFKNKELATAYYRKMGSKGKETYLTYDKNIPITLDEVDGTVTKSHASLNIINTFTNFTPDAYIHLINNLNSINARMVFANNVATLFQSIHNQYGLSECLRVVDALFSKIPQNQIVYLLRDEKDFEIVLHGLKHIRDIKSKVRVVIDGRYQDYINKSVKYNDKYLPLIKDFADYYLVPEENLKLVIQRYDMLALRFLFKKNFRTVLQQDRSVLEKILTMMNVEYANLDENTLNDIINGFVQRGFANKNRSAMSIFHDLLVATNEKNVGKIQELLNLISEQINVGNVLDSIIKNGLIDKNNLISKFYDGKKVDYQVFIELLLNEPRMLDILHEITNQFIAIERNRYSKKETAVQRKLVTKEVYNVNQMIKYVFANNSAEDIFNSVKAELNNSIDELDDKEKEIINNDLLLRQLIVFNINPQGMEEKPDSKVVGIFYNFLKKRINHMVRELLYNQIVISYDRKLVFSNINEMVLEVISELNPELLSKGLFKNEKAFNMLVYYLNKYKMLGWGDRLDPISSRVDLLTSPTIIASFITYFENIYKFAINNRKELLKKKYPDLSDSELYKKAEDMLTLTSLLDITIAFSANFKPYEKLFGKEDFRIILTDPQPYKSRYTKMDKLDNTSKMYVEMYKRDKVTVPPCDKDFNLKSGKKINIVVGNVTNPINLDYGERTEACMRMGGFSDSLYRFAALDKNGFHIRFVNPKNEELISRVTGFRNGNTVFLNELRFSLSEEYTNDEVVEACYLVAQELVNSTKNSKHPIDNVIISAYYCMSQVRTNRVNLHLLNITKGLGNISHDITSQPILLASKNGGTYLSTISLGSENTDLYSLQRDKVRLLVHDDLVDSVQRIDSMNQMLNGKTINEINVENRNDLLIGYVGEDFYCAITLNGTIVSGIIDKRSDNKATLDEFNVYLEKIEANKEVLFADACNRSI